ncbi:hypothetical protein IP88_11485 [alpha proteobacterium AAP81b]|nr:hypothetical protein IP88_11485 [alpha proteobacterium AAP81b]
MGLRPGDGHDQYAGRVGGGESAGGAYPNPHVDGDAEKPAGHGGGQAGAEGSGDHHAASRTSAPDDADGDYRDHPSQQDGAARARFDAAVARDSDNREKRDAG